MTTYLDRFNQNLYDYIDCARNNIKQNYLTPQKVLPEDNILIKFNKNFINAFQIKDTQNLTGFDLLTTKIENMTAIQLNPGYRMTLILDSLSGNKKGLRDTTNQFFHIHTSNAKPIKDFVLPEPLPRDWESRQKIFKENGGTGYLG